VKFGTVLWTVTPGAQNGKVCGPWTEHINGLYTGVADMAGFVSKSSWIEKDNKSILGKPTSFDWGLVDVVSHNDTTIVMNYQSYLKAHFVMTWSTDY